MKRFVLSLTLSRILAGPIIFSLILFVEPNIIVFLIFIAASISDYFDGQLARSFNVESSLGATLDPIADKILLLFTLLAICIYTQDPFIGVISGVILAREFWISALREYAAKNRKSYTLKVTYLSKIKTTVQFFALAMFLFGITLNYPFIIFLASFVLFLSLLITVKTALDYSYKVFSDSS